MSSPIFSKYELAIFLGEPLQRITNLLYGPDSHNRYRHFHIKKRNGTFRDIHSPNPLLRKLQKKIKVYLEQYYLPRQCVHGYVNQRSIFTNVSKHKNKRWIAKLDLKDFFPTINFGRVRGMFLSSPFNLPPDVATLMAQICTFENGLPQGAPTSPIISNIICRGLDYELLQLSRKFNCSYSRYADDITFSTSEKEFPTQIIYNQDSKFECSEGLTEKITKSGFKINCNKTRLYHYTRRQMVTGLVVNKKANVPREFTNQLKGLIHACNKYGLASVDARFKESFDKRNRVGSNFSVLDVIRGRLLYLGYAKGYDNDTYVKLVGKAQKFAPSIKLKLNHSSKIRKKSIRLLTEGKTDLLYFEAILKYLRSEGQFLNLSIQFENSIPMTGFTELLKRLEASRNHKQDVLTVFVFDNDVNLKDLNHTPGMAWKKVSEDIYSLIMPIPKYRKNKVCSELLFNDEFLMSLYVKGRRLYLTQEFDLNQKHIFNQNIYCKYPSHKFANCIILDDQVFEINPATGEEAKVSLSKNAFAETVAKIKIDWSQENLDGFKALFGKLTAIQENYLVNN